MSTKSKNQHKPLPPEEDIKAILIFYYNLRQTDVAIAKLLQDHYDTNLYGMSAKSVQRLRKKWGLQSTRQQNHTLNSIPEKVQAIRKKFPARGAETIRSQLWQEYGMRVPRQLVLQYLKIVEPDAVQARRSRRFIRRRFYAAGVNDVWTMDQHDKWGPRFGLWLHNGIDPFIGFNHWLRIWWTNKKPQLVAKYFLDAVRKQGGLPLTTQSDPGSENYAVANAQTVARQELDPTLVGTLQHRWMRKKKNVKSEANWSVFRRDAAPGYENLFQWGVANDIYHVDDPLESLVFRWLAVPWMQLELDRWAALRNQTAPRSNKHKVLPHGIPELIRSRPDQFKVADFQIIIPEALLDQLEDTFAPKDDPVFQLTPPAFDYWATQFYSDLGEPLVTFDSFWNIYQALVNSFRTPLIAEDHSINSIIVSHFETVARLNEEGVDNGAELPLLAGQAEYRDPKRQNNEHGENGDQPGENGSEYGDFSTDEETDGGYVSDQEFE